MTSGHISMPSDAPNGEDDTEAPTYDERQKIHFMKLLREKWECQNPGHIFCIFTDDEQHFPLSASHISEWVDALCRGEATTAEPPDQMFEHINGGAVWNHKTGEMKVKAASIAPSRRRVAPRSPPGPSSKSVDSISEAKLFSPKSSWFTPTFASTTISSGVPGPGYYGGKGIKWLGEQGLVVMQNAVIMKRGNGHIDRLNSWTRRDIHRPQLGVHEREKVFEMLGDALEMSRQCYPEKVNKMAYSIGRAVFNWLQSYPGIPNTQETTHWLILVHICLIPPLLVRISRHDPLAGDLAHKTLSTLTRVPLAVQGTEAIEHMIRLLACELAYSKCTNQHSWLGLALLRVVQMSCRLRALTEKEVGAVKELVIRREEKLTTGTRDDTSMAFLRPWEVALFAQCALQVPSFKDNVLGHTGLPSLLNALNRALANDRSEKDVNWEGVALTLRALAFLSDHEWVAAAVNEDIVGSLLLVFRRRIPSKWFCIRFWATDTLRNIIAHRPALTRTLKKQDGDSALASLSEENIYFPTSPTTSNGPTSGANKRRSSSSSGPPQPQSPPPLPRRNSLVVPNVEVYKREATKRAEELATYMKNWTSWTPDALPRLEVVPVAAMIMDWEV